MLESRRRLLTALTAIAGLLPSISWLQPVMAQSPLPLAQLGSCRERAKETRPSTGWAARTPRSVRRQFAARSGHDLCHNRLSQLIDG